MPETGHSIRVLIATDHPIFRCGVRTLLQAEPDMQIVGEAADGAEALKLARELKPDILLFDLSSEQGQAPKS